MRGDYKNKNMEKCNLYEKNIQIKLKIFFLKQNFLYKIESLFKIKLHPTPKIQYEHCYCKTRTTL